MKVHKEPYQQLKALNQQLRRQLYDLHSLFEISLELNSILDEEQLVHHYMFNLFGLLGCKSAVILLNGNDHPNDFRPVLFRGIQESQVKDLSVPRTDPFFEIFSQEPRVIDLTRTQNLETPPKYLQMIAAIGGAVVSPLVHRKEFLGFTILGEKHSHRPYVSPELEILSLLSSFVAIAMSNVRLYREMERVSFTDPLTGVFNRRYFERFLKNEVARARRFNHTLSLAMLDVDHFKNFNDTLGHPAGDQLLRELADLLTATVRTTDIVARYGGEEFCVILPEISEDGALGFSERLRKVVASHDFRHGNIQPEGRVTISLGVATFPKDAHMVRDLIAKADAALYEAKRLGRNRVALYRDMAKTSLAIMDA